MARASLAGRLPDEAALLEGLRHCSTLAGGASPSLRWALRTYASTEGAIAPGRQAVDGPGVAALVAASLRGWRALVLASDRSLRNAYGSVARA